MKHLNDRTQIIQDILKGFLTKIDKNLLIYENIICDGINAKVSWIRKLYLDYINVLSITEDQSIQLYSYDKLMKTLIKTLEDDDTDIAQLTLEIFKNLFQSPDNLKVFNSLTNTPLLEYIIRLMDNGNTNIKLRGYELIIQMAKISTQTLNDCESKNLIMPLIECLPGCIPLKNIKDNHDVLTQATVLELIGDLFAKKSEVCGIVIKYLDNKNIFNKLLNYVFENKMLIYPTDNINQNIIIDIDLSLKFLILPGIMRFFAKALDCVPEYYEKWEILFNAVFSELSSNENNSLNGDDENCITIAACLDFLYNITPNRRIKENLIQNMLFPNALKTIVKIYMGAIGTSFLRIRAINTLANLLKSEPKKDIVDGQTDHNMIPFNWYHIILKYANEFGSAEQSLSQLESAVFYNRVLVMVASPIDEERVAILELLLAIAKSLPWGPIALISQSPPQITAYLLYRGGISPKNNNPSLNLNINLNKKDKELKYEILQSVASDRDFYKKFPGPLAIKIKTFMKEGPYYIETISQSQTAETISF
ncbi:unnamed protein product [Gordionus sp. m RMFG-2023]|uniref:26S proteasome non-ATPase regulatory subunit 5-like isoform X2 n=1 Tax=Gordionus sp. m RMFG-2023 TaxID=3053472 RepID=UPI0030E5DCC8